MQCGIQFLWEASESKLSVLSKTTYREIYAIFHACASKVIEKKKLEVEVLSTNNFKHLCLEK